MSTLQISYKSNALAKTVTFKMILPNDIPEFVTAGNPCYQRQTKTLLLLHGYTSSDTEWIFNSQIVELAGKYNLAVICPNGDNSFYLDGEATGRKYATFVGKEIMDYVHKTFGLSDKREDNMACGLSMGGFGALHTALMFPENFGGASALSSALIHNQVKTMKPGDDNGMANYEYYKLMFGEPEKLSESDNNPEVLVKKVKAENKPMPEIFMAVGTEDFLLEANRDFRDYLVAEGVDVEYHESKGVHDFVFWNEYLEPGIKYLLEKLN